MPISCLEATVCMPPVFTCTVHVPVKGCFQCTGITVWKYCSCNTIAGASAGIQQSLLYPGNHFDHMQTVHLQIGVHVHFVQYYCIHLYTDDVNIHALLQFTCTCFVARTSKLHFISCYFHQGTLILKVTFKPTGEKLLNCTVEGLELFSCSLSNEDETALSILDPVSLSLELKPPDRSTPSSPLSTSPSNNKKHHVLEVRLCVVQYRVSHNEGKFLC